MKSVSLVDTPQVIFLHFIQFIVEPIFFFFCYCQFGNKSSKSLIAFESLVHCSVRSQSLTRLRPPAKETILRRTPIPHGIVSFAEPRAVESHFFFLLVNPNFPGRNAQVQRRNKIAIPYKTLCIGFVSGQCKYPGRRCISSSASE